MSSILRSFADLRRSCIESGEIFPFVLMKSLYYRSRGKRIFAQQNCSIKGIKNISIGNRLEIGIGLRGFSHRSDRTFLNVRGRLEFKSNYSIGRGCRFDIGPNGRARFGNGFTNPNTYFIVMHHLEVGEDTVVSWNCQFIDDNFHAIKTSDEKINREEGIRIGNHVWIGCNVLVLKGAVIPSGCVVAAGSIVTKKFTEENCLLAGSPARVVRTGIEWE
jgi:acetyltransferase-like isoleucine patch superfamily enzyme